MRQIIIFATLVLLALALEAGTDSWTAFREILVKKDYNRAETYVRGLNQSDKNRILFHLRDDLHSIPKSEIAKTIEATLRGGATFTNQEISGTSVDVPGFLTPYQPFEAFKAVIEFTGNPDPNIFLGGCSLVEEIFPDIKRVATDGCDDPMGTPLMLMAYRGDLEAVKYLIKKGASAEKVADVSFVNGSERKKKMKAIDFARLKKNTTIIEILEKLKK